MTNKSPLIQKRKPITLPSGFTFHMVEVEGGSFMMGNNDEDAYENEKIIHEVKVPGFWMAEYPTTQALWLELMGGENPSYFQGARRPVEQVSWYDAAAFCNALNALFGYPAKYFVDEKCSMALDIERARSVEFPSSMPIFVPPNRFGFRLPSEAEWEFAARGGRQSGGFRYAGSNKLDEIGWYGENSHEQTQSVGLKLYNELGIFDLSGNVQEWCEDQWHYTYEGAPTDGSPWIDRDVGAPRVLRGGCWFENAQDCRPSFHFGKTPAGRSSKFGFRVVLFPPPVSWPGI